MFLGKWLRKEKKGWESPAEIQNLIQTELERANQLHGPFHSDHEGYAVLLEEFEETEDVMADLAITLEQFWRGVKNNSRDLEILKRLNTLSENLVKESIQVAAMVKKLSGVG